MRNLIALLVCSFAMSLACAQDPATTAVAKPAAPSIKPSLPSIKPANAPNDPWVDMPPRFVEKDGQYTRTKEFESTESARRRRFHFFGSLSRSAWISASFASVSVSPA